MHVEALISLVREQRTTMLPFVGSGMALDAGAPTADQLAKQLGQRCELTPDDARSLAMSTVQAEQSLGVTEVQIRLAEIAAGWRMRPTPALVALAGSPKGTVVTTNYDDGIEVAARSRGIETESLLFDDLRILDHPEPGVLRVVHIHGLPSEPESLVLPGRRMADLTTDSLFSSFMRTVLARRHVLYLGFSLATSELHLRNVVSWIASHVAQPRRNTWAPRCLAWVDLGPPAAGVVR